MYEEVLSKRVLNASHVRVRHAGDSREIRPIGYRASDFVAQLARTFFLDPADLGGGDNNDFFGGSKLEQDRLYAVPTHLIYAFDKPGYWAALSAGYGWNGQSTVDGNNADDSLRLFLSAVAIGAPIGKRQVRLLSHSNQYGHGFRR